MKKISLVLLVAALLFVFMSTSLAAVSYDKDSKTLSVTSSYTGFVEVWLDGNNAGTMTGGSFTKIVDLADGPHTVALESATHPEVAQDGGSFYVGTKPTDAPTDEPTKAPTTPPTDEPTTAPTEAPTTAPTEEPVGPLAISGSYTLGTVKYTVSGLRNNYAELWLDGHATGYTVNSNGSGTIPANLEEGTHTLALHVPGTGETVYASFTVVYGAPVVNSVSYDSNGNLYFTVSNITNLCEVWVDGGAYGYTVSSDGSYPLNKALTCGTHSLIVYNPVINKSSNAFSFTAHAYKATPAVAATCTKAGNTAGVKCETCGYELVKSEVIPALGHDFTIIEGKAATCTEAGWTAGKDCSRCDEEDVKSLPISALGHIVEVLPAVEATCTRDGLTEGEKCTRCGLEIKAQAKIPALGHRYVVVERTTSYVKYECERCGETFVVSSNKPVVNAYGNIVKDANMVDVDYTAQGNKNVLEIVADLKSKPNLTSELGLYLDDALIKQIMKDGYDTIAFVNGTATIEIKLADIKADWFNTNDIIWAYVFSTDPAAEGGILVKVEAQVSGTEKIPAEAFTGVTLKASPADIAVTANGIY